MAFDYVTKQDDSASAPFTDTLTHDDGTAVDLTGATVKLVARALSSATPQAITGTATVTAALSGGVQFQPSAADNATAGLYMANWVVTFSGGGVETFPKIGYVSWSVEPNLTTPGGQQLVGLPDVKDYLNVAANDRSHDAKLVRYINAVTPLIENIVGPVIVRTFEEWHPGGQYWIRLRRRPSFAPGTTPILNIVGCDEYRGPIKYTLSVITDPAAAGIYSVMLDPRIGTVYRRTTGGGVIPFGAGAWGGGMPDAVHVVYEAGQQTVPANVYEAALEAIRVNYEQTMAVGRGSRTRADESDIGTPLGFFLPRRCLELLAPNRRYPSIA